MEASARAGTMSSLCGLSIHPKDLWCLVFRVLRKLLGLPPTLVKKFLKAEHIQIPAIELDTLVATSPELPYDVLTVIFENLEIPDLVRAGSVCSLWYAAYTSLRDLRLYKQSQTPCLFYTSESAGENVGCLYSLVDQREYKLTLPEPPICSRFFIGSSNGWLITADERSELHLVNPITGEQISLPSVTTIEQVEPIFDDSGAVHKYQLSYYTGKEVYRAPEIYALKDLREHCYYKAFVFPLLSTRSYIVVLIHNPYGQLSFARLGDDKWIWLPPNGGYRDCTHVDGLLYALTLVGKIDAFDLTGSTVTRKVIIDRLKGYIYGSMYIIRAPWGDLLQVWRDVNRPDYLDEDDDAVGTINAPQLEYEDGNEEYDPTIPLIYITKKVIVYKVDMAAKELVKINSLPHHMLFLGHNQSFCLSAAEYPHLEANHAYYTDDHEELIMISQNSIRDIGVINLENHRRKEIVSQIWNNWPCPTWIVPNLTRMNMIFSK